MRMPSSQLSPAAGLVALLLTLIPVRAQAQVTADSAARSTPDSAATGSGYTGGQAGIDTSQGKPAADSAAKAAKVPGDSAPAQPATPTLRADSVLTGACSGSRPGTVAPGILLVLFRDSATQKERDSAVTVAGGVVAGAAPTGGHYVRPAADSISSRDLADRSCPTGR